MPFFGVPIRNGLPIGLGSVAGFGVQQFDPSQLFAGGTVAGAWYDPSDLSTMFDSSAGTTPVAMPGLGSAVSVGLMLDKSQGLVLGSELVTNGDFSSWSGDDPVGWSINGPEDANNYVTQAGTSARLVSNGGNIGIRQTILTSGQWYKYTITIFSISGSAKFVFGSSVEAIFSTTGVKTGYIRADGNILEFRRNTACDVTFDDISIKAIPGNHAIAFNNTTARPELRARVNLLTYSEEFDNGVWTKTVSTVTANTQIAPNGTLTADTLTASVGGGFHYINTPTATQAASYTYTICVKKGTSSWIFFGILDTRLNYFNLDTGLFGSVADTCVAQNLGNGWYRLTATGTVTAGSTGGTNIGLASGDGGGNFVAAGTETVHIWGSDFRFTNIGANVPAYQRIADANTYDTSGFPLYLRFDGIDDSMYTPANLNLSGTDKVAVFAGVRKNDNTTVHQLVELSAAVASNVGAFSMPTNDIGPGRWATYLRGSTGTVSARAAGTTAPITTVNTGLYDIALSVDEAKLRINGAEVATSGASSAGTGNFGTYPLYIGARDNSSLWLNGHLHSLIIAGSAVSAGNISATEQWVAGKTGIQI